MAFTGGGEGLGGRQAMNVWVMFNPNTWDSSVLLAHDQRQRCVAYRVHDRPTSLNRAFGHSFVVGEGRMSRTSLAHEVHGKHTLQIQFHILASIANFLVFAGYPLLSWQGVGPNNPHPRLVSAATKRQSTSLGSTTLDTQFSSEHVFVFPYFQKNPNVCWLETSPS